MSKMQRGRKNGNGDDKKHTIIDKNCVRKVIQNNKVLSSTQLNKTECSYFRKKIATEIDKSTNNQKYKSTSDKPRKKGQLSESMVENLRKRYTEAKKVGPKSAQGYLKSLPAQAQEQLKKYGINK